MNIQKFYIYITIFFILLNVICQKQNIIQNNTYENKNPNEKIDRDVYSSKTFFVFKECSIESRNVQFCIEVYQPVCGWFTKKPEECKDVYCRESYANSCFACKDKRVIGYTEGKCKN